MKRLGVSIYPEHSTPEKDKEYLTLAAKNGFTRVFTCLLSVKGSKEKVISDFKDIISHANGLKMEVVLDIAPRVFNDLGVNYHDLSFFYDIGAAGIRLDEGFDGNIESEMTYNKYGLKIEINMSSGTKYVDTIFSFRPNKENLIGSHNFYPQRYTGLSHKHFLTCSKQFKQLGIQTAAFVTSPSATFGPWPVHDGLCTLEEHRELPIDVQTRHLFATGLIDDVIIGNAYASKEELEQLGKLDKSKLTFQVHFNEKATDMERMITLNEPHYNRGDVSDYLIRSTMSRVKYKEHDFPVHDPFDIKRGDIVVGNNLFGQYKGELQIALKDMKADGRKNVIGSIPKEELFLLEHLQPWGRFAFFEG